MLRLLTIAGCDLKREFWRQGIMTEALTEIIRFGFAEMRLNRIGAQVSAYNEQCKQLLLKLHLQLEGTQREQYYEDGRYHDLDLFALLRRDCPPCYINAPCRITRRDVPTEKAE